jgi:SHS2 domain-containing protein
MTYEIFEHTADLGIRVQAADLNSLFAEAGRALFSVIAHNLDDVRAVETIEFQIEGHETDFLLIDWLGELLFTFESRGLLLSQFSVRIDDAGLTASARGEPFDDTRHRLEHEVKAITYHGLRVVPLDKGWLAECILDI